ncbi:hypothetical protein TNCV_3413921 [Trichonephila clavipes]|uniref:Uncharacterized protein n=1 Tax=Trichonephila clavipes TaxID=2585209 RepID=A0A8X6RH33_TRICX|nr:hypothetical protein TNCV_3413921 [Trichonephila clavipes]
MQKPHFREKRSNIPNLTSSSGIASNDEQKANLIANTFVENYTENKRPENYTNIYSDVTNTLTNFFSSPPHTPIPTNPDEICEYVKKLNSKAPGFDNITNKVIKNFPLKVILIFSPTLLVKFYRYDIYQVIGKWRSFFPTHKPGKNKNYPDSYRPYIIIVTQQNFRVRNTE